MNKLIMLYFVFSLFFLACKSEYNNEINKPLNNTQKAIQNKESESQKLLEAVRIGNLNLAKEYIRKGADVNCKRILDSEGSLETPLSLAVAVGNIELVKFLLDNGAKVNSIDAFCEDDECFESESPALLEAIEKSKNIEIVKLLIEKGANVNGANFPLFRAVSNNDLKMAKFLITNGADVNKLEYTQGLTPLMVAVSNDNMEMVKILLTNGANPNIAEETPFPICFAKNVDMVKLLISGGADINAKNTYGYQPLDRCSTNEDILEFLISRGAKTSTDMR